MYKYSNTIVVFFVALFPTASLALEIFW